MSASGRPQSSSAPPFPPHAPPSPAAPPLSYRSAVLNLPSVPMESRAGPPQNSEWPPAFWTSENSSPVSSSSPLGLTETESEEEDCGDYMAGLAEQIAHSMLKDDDDDKQNHCKIASLSAGQTKGAWASQASLSTSPQSILSGGGACWSRGLKNPKATSPVSSSGLSSPPSPPPVTHGEEDALDLLYVELMRLRMEEEMRAYASAQMSSAAAPHQDSGLSCSRQLGGASTPSLSSVPAYAQPKGYWATRARSHSSVGSTQVAEGQFSKGENLGLGRSASTNWSAQQMMQHQQNLSVHHHHYQQQHHQHGSSHVRSRNAAAWASHHVGYQQYLPSLPSGPQQRSGSGMRAVFLGTPGARESGGTGVFLPRRTGHGSDFRRKPACSTVLLPSRIVQALNLNIEDTLSCPLSALATVAARSRDSSSCKPHYPPANSGTSPKSSNNGGKPLHSQLQEVAPDVSLPTEWTY